MNLYEQLCNITDADKYSDVEFFYPSKLKHRHAPNQLVDDQKLSCDIVSQELDMRVEINKHDITNFKFSITYIDFIKEPFFRYDSKGVAHHNKKQNLQKGMITTPHFHKYDEEGDMYAYKTNDLISRPDEFKNVNAALYLFGEEANIIFSKGVPVVKLDETLFSLSQDPLEGITFDL